MLNFSYYAPTKVVFGKGAEVETANLLKEFGAKRVLVHYGTGSVVKSGLLDKITECLEDAGIYYVKLGGAKTEH